MFNTLEETILSLIPSPGPTRVAACRCHGERCIACFNGDSMSFLVRPGDPLDYQELLKKCLVIVSDAPRPVIRFAYIWKQKEIVVKVISLMKIDQPYTRNLICDNYDKGNQTSPVVEALTSPSWNLLHSRVADEIMVYLLRHTSIFLPLPGKQYHQITGNRVFV